MGTVLSGPADGAPADLCGDAAAAFETCLRWAARLEWADLPDAARQRTVLVLADDMAATFSALREPEVVRAHARLLAAAPPGGSASLLAPGRPRLPVAQAAMGNGLAMGWNELDEGFRKAVCHAGLYVLPALLAVAESEDASLQDLLRALALGYETVTRVARAWRLPVMKIHPHALLAPVGAAAGVGFLRRLPPDELQSAIAGAATFGMVGPFRHALQGVLARNTWAPQAAVAGLNALEWAHCGIGGAASSPHEVYAIALGADTDLSALAPHAEDGWAVESGYHKLNACCQYAHSTIEAIESLLDDHPRLRGGADLASIEVEAHPLAFGLDARRPTTTLGAKFSVPHAAAAALVHGHGGLASFDAVSLNDQRIARLRDLVRLRPFEGVRAWPEDRPARVTVTSSDGTRLTAECWSARGGPDQPFTEAQLWDKLAALSAPHAPAFTDTMRQVARAAAGAPDSAALRRPWRQWLDDCIPRQDAAAAGSPPRHTEDDHP